MVGVKCSVCGQGGYWVALDATTGEQRCVNHIGSPRSGPDLSEEI